MARPTEISSPRARLDRFLSGSGYRATLTRQAGGSFVLKVGAAGLSLLSGLLFARILGVESYGAYAYAMAWVTVLSGPALVGGDRLLVREVATYAARGEWELLRGLLGWSARLVLTASLVLAAAGLAVCWLAASPAPETGMAVTMAMLVLPVAALLAAAQAAQRGLQQVIAGQWPSAVAKPCLAIGLLLLTAAVLGQKVGAPAAVAFQGLATLAVLGLALWLLATALPAPARRAAARSAGGPWLRRALPLLLLSGVLVANEQIEVLMLGSFHGPEATALFEVARRGAQLVAFPLLAVSVTLAPAIARFRAADDPHRLQRALHGGARAMLLAAIPIALGLALLGPWFLGLFGPRFVDAYPTLVVLTAGNLCSVAAGAVGTLLVMTGHDRVVTITFLCIIVAKAAALSLLLDGGIVAAAAVASLGTLAANAALCVYAVRALRIDPTALRLLSPGRR